MTLRKFVKAAKVVTDAGFWSDKPMPRIGSTFPLSKARGLRVGTGGSRHPGWHVHATCKSPLACHSGRLRHDDMKRFAGGLARSSRMPFPLTDDDALEIAKRFFRLPSSLGTLQPPLAHPI